MKKKIIVIFIILALITLGFIFGILSVIDRQKGYPPGLELGNNFSYWYDGIIFGSQVPSTLIHGELYTIVSGYNPLLKLIDIYTVNHWYNGSEEHLKTAITTVSEFIPTFPLMNERNSSLGGIAGQKSAEFFGWILPRDYIQGMFINNYVFEKAELKYTAAGTFSTHVFTKANVTRDANNLVTTELTKLYYEQWSGVLVYAEHTFSVFNSSSAEILFFEYEYSFLMTFTNYKWPMGTTLMPVLSFAQPVIDFFSTFAIFILIILLVIAIAYLWRKSSSFYRS